MTSDMDRAMLTDMDRYEANNWKRGTYKHPEGKGPQSRIHLRGCLCGGMNQGVEPPTLVPLSTFMVEHVLRWQEGVMWPARCCKYLGEDQARWI